MRYSFDIKIEKPLDVVIEKFKDEEGLKHWLYGFQKVEHISGIPGTKGAVSDFYFLHKKREMKMGETILEENLPKSIKFGYQSPMGYNEVETVFKPINESNLKLTSNNYFKLEGMMKVFGWLMPGMFKKQSLKYMTNFKAYCESK